jgi:nucleoside phosphorylase
VISAGDTSDVIAIVTALNVEYSAVRANLTVWSRYQHPSGTIYEKCRLPGSSGSLVIACSGVGNTRAAVLTERVIASQQPRAVLFVGVAGALKADLQLGDVVVGTKVYAYQGGTEQDDGFTARPDSWTAPHELEQLARQVARLGQWEQFLTPGRPDRPTVHFRPIAAGEVVLDSREGQLARQLRDHYNDAAAIEMESAGAAVAGLLNNSRPVLTIRGISDRADGAKLAVDRAGWQPVAAANAAAFAMGLVMELSRKGELASQPGTPLTKSGAVRGDGLSRQGLIMVEFCRRLGPTWPDLAAVLGIAAYEIARFRAGDEARSIWQWLDDRRLLAALVPALIALDRRDLADRLNEADDD